MSKMGKLYLESEREEIAFNNSQYEEQKTFLDQQKDKVSRK